MKNLNGIFGNGSFVEMKSSKFNWLIIQQACTQELTQDIYKSAQWISLLF